MGAPPPDDSGRSAGEGQDLAEVAGVRLDGESDAACPADVDRADTLTAALVAGEIDQTTCDGVVIDVDGAIARPDLVDAPAVCVNVVAADHAVDCVVDLQGERLHYQLGRYEKGGYALVGLEPAPQSRCSRSADASVVIDLLAAVALGDRSCIGDLAHPDVAALLADAEVEIPPTVECSPVGEVSRCVGEVPSGVFSADVSEVRDGWMMVTDLTLPIPRLCRPVATGEGRLLGSDGTDPSVSVTQLEQGWMVRADFLDGSAARLDLPSLTTLAAPVFQDLDADGTSEIVFLVGHNGGYREWMILTLDGCDWRLVVDGDGAPISLVESSAPSMVRCVANGLGTDLVIAEPGVDGPLLAAVGAAAPDDPAPAADDADAPDVLDPADPIPGPAGGPGEVGAEPEDEVEGAPALDEPVAVAPDVGPRLVAWSVERLALVEGVLAVTTSDVVVASDVEAGLALGVRGAWDCLAG